MKDTNAQILQEVRKLQEETRNLQKLTQEIHKLQEQTKDLQKSVQKLEKSHEQTNNNVLIFKDEILGKLENMQTDITLLSGDKDLIENHEDRISKLETKVFPPS